MNFVAVFMEQYKRRKMLRDIEQGFIVYTDSRAQAGGLREERCETCGRRLYFVIEIGGAQDEPREGAFHWPY